MKTIDTVAGPMKVLVPEFKPQEYKGLRSGLGGERKSSKHYKCHKPCCLKANNRTLLKQFDPK